jgi:hypothetical protein
MLKKSKNMALDFFNCTIFIYDPTGILIFGAFPKLSAAPNARQLVNPYSSIWQRVQ